LNAAPGPNTAAGLAVASKQHHTWLSTMISNSCTGDALSTLETFQEDHKNDSPCMYFCLLLEYSSASRDAIIKAEENLHPTKISMDSFGHNIKTWSKCINQNASCITCSGGHISHTHWIHVFSTLEGSHSECFWLQVMKWSKNWRKQQGESSNWKLLQFFTKADSKYTCLVDLGQWHNQDPNASIIALQAMQARFSALQASVNKPTPLTNNDTNKNR
jgi:hypothetical protein